MLLCKQNIAIWGNFMFFDNLKAECDRQNLQVTPLFKELGISTGNISPWKRGGNVNSAVLLKLSERLGVTTDYLLKGTTSSSDSALYCANDNERELLTMYRELPVQNRTFIFDAIKAAYEREQAGQNKSEKLSG